MHRCPCLKILALLLLPISSLAVSSHGLSQMKIQPQLLYVQNDVGPKSAANLVRQATGGRVLSVDRVITNSGPAYKVKVLFTNGRIRVVLVDAASGSVR